MHALIVGPREDTNARVSYAHDAKHGARVYARINQAERAGARAASKEADDGAAVDVADVV